MEPNRWMQVARDSCRQAVHLNRMQFPERRRKRTRKGPQQPHLEDIKGMLTLMYEPLKTW
ncbi:hypothetical protein PG994_015220 [Apiospora phragmitis]|uniref:Uncharacterized protein n=1 Tax=Apiospora phragmitis TaxID=2905665 RepID=A0ABR1ST65_9PEZI